MARLNLSYTIVTAPADGWVERRTIEEGQLVNPGQTVTTLVPGTLIGVGIIGLESDWLKYQNKEIKEELQENIDRKFTIDDFSQYVPMAATYGLKLCGVKGKHGYGDLTIILGTAYALMGVTVNVTKNLTKVERPD